MHSKDRSGAMGGAAFRLGLAGLLLLGLGACAAQYQNHGYIPPEEDLEQIAVGIDTRASVEETLGPAASGGVVGDDGLYYVRSRMRSFATRAPEVVDREVVAISFDGQGVVSNVERFGLEKGQFVPLSRRTTNEGLNTKPFLRQLLGNLGRFDPSNFIR